MEEVNTFVLSHKKYSLTLVVKLNLVLSQVFFIVFISRQFWFQKLLARMPLQSND